MRMIPLGLGLAALLAGAVPAGVAQTGQAAGSGATVTGTVTVMKTRLKTKGAKSQKHVVLYLEKVGGDKGAPPKKHARMDQKGLVFIPHVLAVQKGTTVDFLNSDEVLHNIFCQDDCCKILGPDKKPTFMDLGNWGKGEVRNFTFNFTGTGVLLCKLHPEMAAYVVVVDTPYFTTVEVSKKRPQTARYAIKNVPPGQYVLKVWNKKCSAEPRKITIEPAQKTVKADLELRRKKRRR